MKEQHVYLLREKYKKKKKERKKEKEGEENLRFLKISHLIFDVGITISIS